ncbi:DUF3343 domain-containing protein [Zongyangia hominis]|uniref:DUF3343 domain-containing protein n=1 Tax=Zongyangia hominis TaxID=2763677 RepID=A0A926IB20_9FIRM|nr:DUF3343 domain-containing protein [Zongyangia hominis]MBC8569823.1 DUF3343 domain-containing protein [Zongyangia hominis]
MGKPVIMLSSVTLAMKGQRLLQKNGIRCDIERIQNYNQNGGCAYGLKVLNGDVERAMELLRTNRILIVGLYERAD